MDEDSPLSLPPELQARLDAAGVHDDESLNTALERDPELRALYEIFLNEHRDEIVALQLNAPLAAFAQTENDAQMIEFWNQVPRELEQPFLDAAQNVIAQAEADGKAENVAGLKQRLDTLREMLRDTDDTPPVVRALLEFLNAPDDAAVRVVFQERRVLLQPYEAQRTLDEKFQSDNEDGKKRIAERSALLRELRGVAPRDLTPDPSPARRGEQEAISEPRGVNISGTANVTGDLVAGDHIVQGDSFTAQTMNVTKVEAGGTLNVTNINDFHFEEKWNPPPPPNIARDSARKRGGRGVETFGGT